MQRGNLAPVINRGPSNNVENRETFDSRNQVESNFLFFFSLRPISFSLCDEGEALELADCKYSNENSANFPELTNFYRVYKETRLMRFAKSLLKRKLGALTREISGCGSVKLGDGIFGMDKRDI